MTVSIFWSTRDWARAIAELPAPGPLPTRTVLVPRERVAHSLRREVIRAGLGPALAGTRFIPMAAAAADVLDAAGVPSTPGEETLRAARLLALFRGGLPLRHFPADLLCSKPGWDEAFAQAIGDLEAADLGPSDLERQASTLPAAADRLRDVAVVWHALDTAAGASWTTGRFYLEAARMLEARAASWLFPGPVLVAVTGHETAAQARFLRAIPGATLGLLAARPIRERHVARVEALFGEAAARALASSMAPRSAGSERDLLASYLFEPPAILADPARPRSAGPDGTVDLEEHAGVDAEVEATADWVARRVSEGVGLEDLAVLMPALDPLANLVAARLARLPWTDGAFPIHVAGGLPVAGLAAGARALAVVRALRAYLSGETLAEVLPALRTTSDRRHLSHGAATDLVWSLGTAGGNAAHPRGALEWSERAAFRQGDLARQLESARGAADDPERSGLARRARDLERLLADLQAIRPALDALVGVARDVVNGRSLGEVWPALRAFLEEWLLQPGAGPRAPALLDERLAGVADDRGLSELRGDDALRLIEDAVTSIRLPGGRFGDPAVYVGSITGAAGLRFRAVRMIGLAEGHLPPVPREDPVLPDALRARLAAPAAGGRSIAPPTARDVALRALHALDAAVRDAETCVALSVPRVDVARSLREPASIILEAAAALGRPNAATGERRRVIPDTPALRRDAFAPARQALVEFRRLMPIGETAWQDGVALCVLGVPGRWRVSDARDLDRVVALLGAAGPGPLDGILGAVAAKVKVPGLTPEWPISPSVLQALLQCPYQFLLGHFLGLEEPASAPARREIGQPAYGSLFHVVAEQFYRTHGAAFSAGEGNLENWLERADVIVDQTFAEFLEQYPLIGAAVRSRERERLRGDLRDLLEHGWLPEGGRRFVAVERAFGWPAPVELPLGRRSLFVRGYVDRIEVDGRLALVRDLKTGRAHPRIGGEREPDPALDVQIAVYGLVAARLAREWDIPERVGVAYTYVGRGADEREYRLDFHQTLEPAARRWLTVAADLLAERAFPRTADPGDCEYCAFRPVCGDGVYERAARLIRGGRAALRAFGAMKGVEIDAEPRP